MALHTGKVQSCFSIPGGLVHHARVVIQQYLNHTHAVQLGSNMQGKDVLLYKTKRNVHKYTTPACLTRPPQSVISIKSCCSSKKRDQVVYWFIGGLTTGTIHVYASIHIKPILIPGYINISLWLLPCSTFPGGRLYSVTW